MTYAHTVTGEGDTLVLLHGFTGSSENWQPHVTDLAKTYKVVTVDLPGHGKTTTSETLEEYTMPHIADNLFWLLEDIGSNPVHLLGYSMGGRLALYFALHYPSAVKSLILESASPGLATEEERTERRTRDNALADRIEREGITSFVDFWEKLSLWESQKQLADTTRANLRQQRLKNNPQGLAKSLRGMGTGVQPSLWNDLPTLLLPTLLITGEQDTKFITIAREMIPLIPTVKHAIIQGAGHTTHLEKPDAFRQAVIDFLS